MFSIFFLSPLQLSEAPLVSPGGPHCILEHKQQLKPLFLLLHEKLGRNKIYVIVCMHVNMQYFYLHNQ